MLEKIKENFHFVSAQTSVDQPSASAPEASSNRSVTAGLTFEAERGANPSPLFMSGMVAASVKVSGVLFWKEWATSVSQLQSKDTVCILRCGNVWGAGSTSI
ncbi:hypothetical protein DR999_PMT07111 [Platysternon megacephalum]|uniref:Uncharacterized protein n=1 Tax=Platysternon megacephalum TaxID=55544 RepID=A0A4D9EI86_9SAUR|nr:hypothetical protein DR999_PMT07111 [Platysternon megacephalum]